MRKKWSEMTAQEHLDEAQRLFEETISHSPNANGLHSGLIRAQAHTSAARTVAMLQIAKEGIA